MPEIGQIVFGRDIGRCAKNGNAYVWHACNDCGKERWVQILCGQPESARCLSCANQRERNPNWRGENVTPCGGRSRAIRWYRELQACAKCGSLKSQRHHLDDNPLNNDPDNIVWLCSLHHHEIHKKAQCVHGHFYNEENTIIEWYGNYWKRRCKTCRREGQQVRYWEAKASLRGR